MSFFTIGHENAETAYNDTPREANKSERVYLKPEQTGRFMFLDDEPAAYWEHQFKFDGDWRNWEPCHKKNVKLAEESGGTCPICSDDNDRWAYFVGLHTVISMTPWFTKKDNTEVNFTRKIFPAKIGSKSKPGVLKKLHKLKLKYGRLRGLIFDIERPGKQTESCGSEFDLVEKVEPSDIKAYSLEQMTNYVNRRNEGKSNDKKISVDKLLEWSPWEPFDWDDKISPRSIREVRSMFLTRTPSSREQSKKDDFSDDDLPY